MGSVLWNVSARWRPAASTSPSTRPARAGVADLITLTGDPARVTTIADFGAAALGVKVTGGGDFRATDALDEAAALFEAGHLQVPVARTYTFADAADAHRASQDGHVRGKLVLIPR